MHNGGLRELEVLAEAELPVYEDDESVEPGQADKLQGFCGNLIFHGHDHSVTVVPRQRFESLDYILLDAGHVEAQLGSLGGML
jgi:hypothetical protein